MTNSTSLVGQNILITGAAGRIGSATARHALKSGATVLLADIAPEPLELLVENLACSDRNRVHTFVNNVATQTGIDALITKAVNSVNSIDGAVHSAYPTSAGWGTSFEEINPEYLYQDLNMQLGGAILFSQRLLRHFQNQGKGSLVHLASIQGIRAPKFEHYRGTNMSSPIEYAAIKSGIISITKWLAKYSANQNIRVNCVSPGGILDSQPIEFVHQYRQSCTNIGMLSAEQVASTIIFLLSPEAAPINGQNLIVDDGWSL